MGAIKLDASSINLFYISGGDETENHKSAIFNQFKPLQAHAPKNQHLS